MSDRLACFGKIIEAGRKLSPSSNAAPVNYSSWLNCSCVTVVDVIGQTTGDPSDPGRNVPPSW